MKICFLAPSGYGKSTAIEILSKSFNIKNIKIAEPLYEMQNAFYCRIGKEVENQDGELLQFLGQKIRKENKYYLLDTFKKHVKDAKADIISNDDCRPMDYQFLKDMGFVFVKINGFSHDRKDHTPIDKTSSLEWTSDIPFDYEVDNIGSLEEYEYNLKNLIEKINNKISKCYILPTINACNCNCIFCISKSRDFSRFPTFLQFDDKFKENINLLERRGIKRFEITGGGEPLLNKDIQLMIDYIKEVIPDSYIKLYTNGYTKTLINNIDEIDISISSFDDSINNNFMQPSKSYPIKDILSEYFTIKCKKRLSIVVMKGGIDTPEKLHNLITQTEYMIDEYVVRTMYKGAPSYSDLYVDFEYEKDNVVWERNNTGTSPNNLILATDNCFYSDFNLVNKRSLMAYLMLKPDSRTYINEILNKIRERLIIKDIYLMNNFKDDAKKMYYLKHKDYFELVVKHLEYSSFMFGNNGLIVELDGDYSIEQLLEITNSLKKELRNTYGLTGRHNFYISNKENFYHLNLMHCPDPYLKYYDKDFSIIESMDTTLLTEDDIKLICKYKSYNIF